MVARSHWALGRFIVLLIMGGFVLLLIEVRYLHDEVLREHAVAWTPIVYSGLMTVATVVALCFWDRGGRRVLFWAFAAALVIGPLGCWFHNEGRPWRGLQRELAVWSRPFRPAPDAEEHQTASGASENENKNEDKPGPHQGHEAQHEEEGGGPPPLAPLAIAGLGLLGMFACARRFESPPQII